MKRVDYRMKWMNLIGDLRAGVDALRAHPEAWRAYSDAIVEARVKRGQKPEPTIDAILEDVDAELEARMARTLTEIDEAAKGLGGGRL